MVLTILFVVFIYCTLLCFPALFDFLLLQLFDLVSYGAAHRLQSSRLVKALVDEIELITEYDIIIPCITIIIDYRDIIN